MRRCVLSGVAAAGSEQLVKVVKEMQLRPVERDAVVAGERFDPLRTEMVFDVADDGLEIDVAVATAGLAAIDETEMAAGVEQDIVEGRVAVNEDDVLRQPR